MCGIGAVLDLSLERVRHLEPALLGMNELLAHRGPDGEAVWQHSRGHVGFAHRRLKIIGLETGDQPMHDGAGNWITYNGEIYNYLELAHRAGRDEFRDRLGHRGHSAPLSPVGTRTACYHLRGMFAFALWDESERTLFCARDRFGIKPLYYTVATASSTPPPRSRRSSHSSRQSSTDQEALEGLLHLPVLARRQDALHRRQRTDAGTRADDPEWLGHRHVAIGTWATNPISTTLRSTSTRRLRDLVEDSVDSICAPTSRSGLPQRWPGFEHRRRSRLAWRGPRGFQALHRQFAGGPEYDESAYARDVAAAKRIRSARDRDHGLTTSSTTSTDVIYHLDYPVAGPGLVPAVHGLESWRRDTARSCWAAKAATRSSVAMRAICSPTSSSASRPRSTARAQRATFIVTYESIIPNLARSASTSP